MTRTAAAMLAVALPLAACASSEPTAGPTPGPDADTPTAAAAPPSPAGAVCEPLTPAQEAAVEFGGRQPLDIDATARRVAVGDVNGTPFYAVAATTGAGIALFTVWGESEADHPQAQALNEVATSVTVFATASSRFAVPDPLQDAVVDCLEAA